MEHTVDTKMMDSLKALAETNIKVSEARETLSKLQEEETDYLVKRERKALGRIQKVHDESAELVKQTTENYQEVHEICNSVSQLAGFLVEAYASFTCLRETFDEKAEAWELNAKDQEHALINLKTLAQADRVKIENEKKSVERAKELIEQDRRKLADERGTLERAIARLKANKI